jgi:beta-lactam-binding protein with PASTA domain
VAEGSRHEELVPDLVGLDTEAARRLLRTAHLRSGVVRFARSREFDTGVVMEQDPPANAWVAEGTRVNVTVSSGRLH